MVSAKAYTRAVSPLLGDCELTHLVREAIDVSEAIRQHDRYEAALAAGGLDVVHLAPLADMPDATFVEDTALILGEHAVVLVPGAPSRRNETQSVASALASDFIVHHLAEGHVDGGDVLRIGRHLHVGRSGRSDDAGIKALGELAGRLGYEVFPASVRGCLHLKSAVTLAGPDAAGKEILVHNPQMVDPRQFDSVEPLAVADGETWGANVVRAGSSLLVAADSPSTAELLRDRGFNVVELDISQMRKAEAALTCMSLIAGD
jgi:dimethylargininase